MPSKIVRVIHADHGETIEVHWHRADVGAPYHVLIERHTAPPRDVWIARIERQQPPAAIEKPILDLADRPSGVD